MQKRGPHTIVSSKKIYENPWITIREDHIIRPDGKKGMYGVVECAPGVLTAALTAENDIFLVTEFLYAAGTESPCLPGGGIDGSEIPLEAAKRELYEEAGVEASEWKELGHINPFPMVMNTNTHLFIARNARVVAEHEEEFTLQSIPLEKAVHMVLAGEIIHTASCEAILRTHLYVQGF